MYCHRNIITLWCWIWWWRLLILFTFLGSQCPSYKTSNKYECMSQNKSLAYTSSYLWIVLIHSQETDILHNTHCDICRRDSDWSIGVFLRSRISSCISCRRVFPLEQCIGRYAYQRKVVPATWQVLPGCWNLPCGEPVLTARNNDNCL